MQFHLERTIQKFAGALLLTGAIASEAAAADLTVRIEGAATGPIYVTLFDSDDAWKSRRGIRADRADYKEGHVTTFKNLPSARYAVAVFVDANNNGQFDFNPAGQPLEKYGVSRDALGNMGPPAFQDAAIELNEDLATTIHLR